MLTQQCPHCGSYNVETAAVCYFCKKELPRSAASPQSPAAPALPIRVKTPEDSSTDYRRPGCVTIYAIWIFFSGVMGIISALYLPTVIAGDPMSLAREYPEIRELDLQAFEIFLNFFKYYLVFFFVYSVITLLVGWGLWTMRNWARVVILVIQGLSLAVSIFLLFYSVAVSGGNLIICGVYTVSLIFPAWIFLWFFLNRWKFR
jgi:hypothetical protein